MITNEEFALIQRFADELRKAVPIPQREDDVIDRIRKITYQYFWDVLALTEQKFRLEFNDYAEDLAVKNGQ